eukprot:TRINITY_DN22629_c0_g1_i7.p1 TRINITY_DN22629_c0_g1~~TRINITY_DN22629_c0_g1_i7.p1  ORF type:complete len:844 (+),score=156.18 TRINITY_DN22629_c0_g1_i7:468-2999(+)
MWVNVGGEEESQERYGLLIEKVIIFPLGRNFHKYRGSNDGESFISCSLQPKKRGRRKGSKNKLSPDITKKLGDANLHYAAGRYVEAIHVLNEVVRLAPTLGDSYHMLGLIYNAIGDKIKAMNFYILAACLTPKDPYIWKLLIARSMEMGNISLVMSFLSKAISADPKDVSLRFHRASLYIDLGSYRKAADSYDQILGICPANVEARMMAAKLYQKCGQVDKAINILEDYVKEYPTEADLSVIDLLATIQMENKAHGKALQLIERARFAYCTGKELPLHLTVKAVICEAHLGNLEKAECLLKNLQMEEADDHGDLITKVADSFMNLGHYEYALKYYFMLDGKAGSNNGFLLVKIAQCYLSLKEKAKAVPVFSKALLELEDNIDVRLTLASLLLEEGKEGEAIALLSPPKNLESTTDTSSVGPKPWWLSGKVKMHLAKIYHAKGMLEEFVDAIFSPIRETLFIETMNKKVRMKKKLPKSVLYERVKLLDDQQDCNVWCGFRPVAAPSELLKAARARKLLQKKAALKEEKKAAALAAGLDWQSDESDDEPSPKVLRKPPPLPELLKDEEHFRLIIDLCKALASLQRYWEALEVVNHVLELPHQILHIEKKEELRSLGAQIASNTTDPRHGYDYVRYLVQQHPYSLAAWNCYYKVVSRLESKLSKHAKFLHRVRVTHKDSVPPMLITGHQLSMGCQYQAAAREYLEAYKLQPENPLVNLCVGTALINLALGFRIQNKHQCVVQGFAFLHNYQRICQNSQEALYNIARAYHHVGLVTLATIYYEKVLAMCVKEYPIPKLPNENLCLPEKENPGYCNLHREAAYNLHLIYKKSGALDLARQVLKDHCNP